MKKLILLLGAVIFYNHTSQGQPVPPATSPYTRTLLPLATQAAWQSALGTGGGSGNLVTNSVTTNTGNPAAILSTLGGASLTANQTFSGSNGWTYGNLATNGLVYSNAFGLGEGQSQSVAVIPGHVYVYYPADWPNPSGNYTLLISGTNLNDPAAGTIDPSGNSVCVFYTQTSQAWTANRTNVYFIDCVATSGSVKDQLYDETIPSNTYPGIASYAVQAQTAVNASNVNTAVTATTATNVSGGTLAGNAQAGAVTNLEAYYYNAADFGHSLSNAFKSANATIQSGLPASILLPQYGNYPDYYNVFFPLIISNGSGPYFDSTLIIQGRGSDNAGPNGPNGQIIWTGTNGAMFSTANSGGGIDVRDTAAVNKGVGSNCFAAFPTGEPSFNNYASGTLNWNNVYLGNWAVGAVLGQSGMQVDNFYAQSNGIAIWLPPYADGGIINGTRVWKNTNAAIVVDAKSERIYLNTELNNIDLLYGGGQNEDFTVYTESDTNAALAIGFPTNWPYQDIFSSNQNAIGPFRLHDGSDQQGSPTNDVVKIYNGNSQGGAIDDFTDTSAKNFIESTVAGADTQPYLIQFSTAATNWMKFSDGSTIPTFSTPQLGINYPDYEYTKGVLKYSRDTNGDVSMAGALSAGSGTFTNTLTASSFSSSGGSSNFVLLGTTVLTMNAVYTTQTVPTNGSSITVSGNTNVFGYGSTVSIATGHHPSLDGVWLKIVTTIAPIISVSTKALSIYTTTNNEWIYPPAGIVAGGDEVYLDMMDGSSFGTAFYPDIPTSTSTVTNCDLYIDAITALGTELNNRTFYMLVKPCQY